MINVYQIKSEEPKTPFAPVYNYYICTADISTLIDFNDIKNVILKKEKEIIKKYDTGLNDAYTELGHNSLTSRFEHYNIFDWPEMFNLKSAVKSIHHMFLSYLQLETKPVYINGWANVMRKGEQIKTHIHNVDETCYLGGHICVACDQSSTFYINPVNTINDPEIFEIENKVGQITLFSNCIPHYTSKHSGDSERITMAFDMNIAKIGNSNVLL
tara:strand:+ start:1827 stop:2468 length:642 start_codon:yes stop_codon:yes gene_type:complete